jgi:carbon-monoxide dehydrogenase medium subunit
MAAAAVFYDEDKEGTATNAHVAVFGVGDRPVRLPQVEDLLNGNIVVEAKVIQAGQLASASVAPTDDIHASAAYRRALVGTMVERALKGASA